MDSLTRKEANVRLKRISGQVAGIRRMVDDNRYCVDVLLQIAAVQAALGEVGRIILSTHVETCLVEAVRSNQPGVRQSKLDELMDIFSRYCLLGANGRRPKRTAGSRGRP